jgi:hypothetical protein
VKIDPLIHIAKFPERCRLDLCRSRCCRFGVWTDVAEKEAILANREIFAPYLREEAADPALWFGGTTEDKDCPSGMAVETMPVGGYCAFFHPAHGCALQKGAAAAGLHEWHLKPRFCVMFPLVVADGSLTVDEDMKSLWCMREKNRTHPILASMEKEVRYLFGDPAARDLKRRLDTPEPAPESDRSAPGNGRRG